MNGKIIGIDPGSRQTGIGVIQSAGQQLTVLHYECLRLGSAPLSERLGEIFRHITSVIEDYQPDSMSVENVFVANNPASALKLGQARGAAVCAGVVAGLPVAEYSPRTVKQSLVGKGSANKDQVQHMVKVLLGLQGKLQADSADALAIAITHAHTQALNRRVLQAAVRS